MVNVTAEDAKNVKLFKDYLLKQEGEGSGVDTWAQSVVATVLSSKSPFGPADFGDVENFPKLLAYFNDEAATNGPQLDAKQACNPLSVQEPEEIAGRKRRSMPSRAVSALALSMHG